MSEHRILSLKPQLRLEWRGKDGQNETEQPDHSASLDVMSVSRAWAGITLRRLPQPVSWRNDRAALFRSGHPGLAIQVEVAA